MAEQQRRADRLRTALLIAQDGQCIDAPERVPKQTGSGTCFAAARLRGRAPTEQARLFRNAEGSGYTQRQRPMRRRTMRILFALSVAVLASCKPSPDASTW